MNISLFFLIVVVVQLICKSHRESEDRMKPTCSQPSDCPISILSTAPISAGNFFACQIYFVLRASATPTVYFSKYLKSAAKELR